MKDDLPGRIACRNHMHPEIGGIHDLIHVADGIELLFQHRCF